MTDISIEIGIAQDEWMKLDKDIVQEVNKQFTCN